MPRRRYEKIFATDLREIERQAELLRIAMRHAQISVTPFRAHYNALSALDDHLRSALNLLNDRPADYREPLAPPMSAPSGR